MKDHSLITEFRRFFLCIDLNGKILLIRSQILKEGAQAPVRVSTFRNSLQVPRARSKSCEINRLVICIEMMTGDIGNA